jgi:hypothetical protein
MDIAATKYLEIKNKICDEQWVQRKLEKQENTALEAGLVLERNFF